MEHETGVIEIGDKRKSEKAQVPATIEYHVDPGDFRLSQARAAAELAASNNFRFHDLALPANKELLETLKGVTSRMGTSTDGLGALADGSVLEVSRKDGHLSSATLIGANGVTDVAAINDRLTVSTEAISGDFGARQRLYRPDQSILRELNMSTDGNYRDELHFDAKGTVIQKHSQTATDITDDRLLPDGGGLNIHDHLDPDPSKAYTLAQRFSSDLAITTEQKFGDGNFVYLQQDKNGVIARLDKSDIGKGIIDHFQLEPDGTMKKTTDRLL